MRLMKKIKTNAMRLLDKAGIAYNVYTYDIEDGFVDGVSVAEKIGHPAEKVFKTLVAQGTSKEYYVFIVPVASELDLKAAARVVQEKAVEMIKVKDLVQVTGYVRGGCSPIGMKKSYQTVLDSSSQLLDKIIVSAGKPGYQVELAPSDLLKILPLKLAKIVK